MLKGQIVSFSNSNVPPDYDSANQGTLQGVIRQALQTFLMNTDDMLPATVISYDRVANVASVQPCIQMVTTDGTLVGRGAIASVPVLSIGGGGFLVNFPLVGGSRGWIKANDRDISLYLQASATAPPNTKRFHSFSDGLFIPDVVAGFTVNGEDANNMVIQNTDGTIRVALWPDRVKVTTPNGTGQFGPDRILFTSPLFQIDSAAIQFSSSPVVGTLSP